MASRRWGAQLLRAASAAPAWLRNSTTSANAHRGMRRFMAPATALQRRVAPILRGRAAGARAASAQPSAHAKDEEAARKFLVDDLGHRAALADAVIASLKAPGSGIPAGMLEKMLRSLAGQWEIGVDAGLNSLINAVELELAEREGKRLVRFTVRVPHSGAAFACAGFDGMTLRDVVESGAHGGELLGEYLECACAGVMACSTCHVIVDSAWAPAAGAPCEAEQDMLDLAFEPTDSSRLGCQLRLAPHLDGLVVAVPAGAHNHMDHIPFPDR